MTSKKASYFSKMVLENSRSKSSVPSLRYEPENSDVHKIRFAEWPDIADISDTNQDKIK